MNEETHVDSNVPGNPAYHFSVVPPGTPVSAGWTQRTSLLGSAQIGTMCVHAGALPDPAYGSVAPPIYQTSTFAFNDLCTNAGYDYTRSGNPTRVRLEDAISRLEGGSGAACTASGMAAVLLTLNLLESGSHVLSTFDLYGGTFRTFEHAKLANDLSVDYLDLADLDAVARSMRPRTRMVWIETPSNPLLRLTDIAAVARIAHDAGALVVVDNTFLGPVFQRPFDFGADLVVHSTTKYLNGHSDVVGGAVVAAGASAEGPCAAATAAPKRTSNVRCTGKWPRLMIDLSRFALAAQCVRCASEGMRMTFAGIGSRFPSGVDSPAASSPPLRGVSRLASWRAALVQSEFHPPVVR